MEILNLAIAALFESLVQNNIDKALLLEGTQLNLEDALNVKKRHSWGQFVKMYKNCADLLGPEKAAREIAYHGIYNENLSTLRKTATGFLDAKNLYWYLAIFASKHLFKNAVNFKYTKISAKEISMEININPELPECPLLFETYAYLYENVPTLLGLPKAHVQAAISDHRSIYNIKLERSSYFKHIFSRFFRLLEGYSNTVSLLGELEKQANELEKLVEEKSQLLRIVSHDIANQANITNLCLDLVLENKHLHSEDRSALERAKRSSNILNNILKSVQNSEIARLKGFKLVPVDLDPIFTSLNERFIYKLKNKKLALNCQNNLPENIKPMAEALSLEFNVLGNLVSNAIKFSHENSVILLEARLLNNHVLISISDEGIGISEEEKNNLLNNKIKNSHMGTQGEVGTGFGLGIVKSYVDLYGGKISVHQNIPKGTIFTIELAMHIPQ